MSFDCWHDVADLQKMFLILLLLSIDAYEKHEKRYFS